MYLFRQYFEEKTSNKELFTYTITLDNCGVADDGLVATFSYPESYSKVDSNFKYLSGDTPTTTLYQKEGSIYTPIANNNIITSENYVDDDIYYLTALDSMYKLDSKKDNDDDKVIKDYEYNRDQQYFEKQWVINFNKTQPGALIEFNSPVQDGLYELFKVDLYNGKAYIRSFNHLQQPTPTELSFSFESGDFKWDSRINQLEEVYEPIDLFEMKCNWIMNNTNNLPGVYRKLDIPSKLVSNMASHIFTSDSYKVNLIKHFPNTQNDYSDLDASDFNEYYAMNFSMPKFQYKKGNDYYNIDFVNYNNSATKYRRISVSNSGHVALDIITGTSIATGAGAAIGVAAGMLVPGLNIAAGASMLLTYAIRLGVEHIWMHGNTTWGTEGWTYQDVQSEPMDGFNSSWYGGQRQVYVKTKDSWSYVKNANSDSRALLTAQNFLYTYNSLDKTKNYYYKPTYWRFLNINDYINPYDKYYMISTSDGQIISTSFDVANVSLSKSDRTIDAVSNYPLSYIMNKLPVEDLDTSDRIVISSILNDGGFQWDNNTSSWFGPNGGSGNIYIICEEDYIKSDLGYLDRDTNTDSVPTATNITELASATWYDSDGFKYDWIMNHKTTLADGFYIHKANENYLPAKEKPENLGLDDVFYYRKDPTTEKMTKLYTFKQLASQGNIYYRSGDSVTFKTFNEQTDVSYNMNIYEYKDNKYTFKENRIIEFSLLYNEDLSEANKNKTIDLITTKYSVERSWIKLDNLTHGQFWATYRDSNESALLQEAMVIETNLTEYWTNAYYASKNCRYFLPQFWQPVVSGQINRFSGNIVQQLDENTIILSNVFIPKVSISSQQPKFQYKYNEDTTQLSNENQTQYYTEDLVSKHYNSQPWLEDIIKYLGFKEQGDDKISVMILNNKASYYTREFGGTTWYEMLNNIGINQYRDYDIFGGWYDMAIKVLKNKYQSYAVTGYNEARRKHNQIWREIYTQYPNLIYEQSYTNPDATTSSDLLSAAQFAFKQYTDIERQYNIQTIDLASLKGYEGQHLHIGDAIQLDADELYEEYDDIKTSLLQYLFISDISYDLRNDANIQLTVNNIKYSDKVIGELVKLIR